MTETSTIFRTYKQGVFKLYDGTWGKYLAPTIDPDANVVEFTDEHFKLFELNEVIHQIPSNIWSAWIDLCFYYADKVNKNVEVSVRILRCEEDPSQYRFVVPIQDVSKGSVRADDFQKSVDLVTGEELTAYPPSGWVAVGSSHSHNTMNAFFSGTDDTYELSDPGLHIVVGSIDHKKQEYRLKISVTANNRRFIINEDDESRFIDFEPDKDSKYHPKVLEYVTIPAVKSVQPVQVKNSTLQKFFVGNFTKDALNKQQSEPVWHGNLGSSSSDVGEIENAILEYIDVNEYEVKKLERLLGILQECEDAISCQLLEIKRTFEDTFR
jgi:hypothetical protein